MSNPVALITGAAGGIGRHFAGILQQQGYRLVLGDIDGEGLSQRYQPDDILHCRRLDVTRVADWQAFLRTALDQFGRIDYLFNIAGVVAPGYVHETDIELIDRHLDVNTKGVMYGTRLAAEQMVDQGSGHIINIASLAGIAPIAGIALYSASKFAVRGFSIASAYELRPRGVHVSVVCPDLVDTPMLDLQLQHPEAVMSFSGSKNPLTPADVSQVLLQVMQTKAIESAIPAGRGRLAKLGNVFPGLGARLTDSLRRKGRGQWEKLKKNRKL